MKHLRTLSLAAFMATACPGCAAAREAASGSGALAVSHLRCEYRVEPLGIDTPAPRLAWEIRGALRGERQTAHRVLVASSPENLAAGRGDLWDSGRVAGDGTRQVVYAGRPLSSREPCHWKVRVWDRDGRPSHWSAPSFWSMGLLGREDWKARWISHRDETPLHTSRRELYLPAPRHYRRQFEATRPIRRATVHASALGIYELRINGRRVGDAWFTPGWSDYRQRAYYNTFDVGDLLVEGENVVVAVVAEGWYSGYVGFGLLVGYGPNRTGRYFYGKTPALLVQLEIEYADGSRERIVTDPAWRVTGDGPIREADMIMGEAYDARREMPGWDRPGFDDSGWDAAIPAADNGSTRATFFDTAGEREVELGFVPPPRLQAYSTDPVRVTEELHPVKVTSPGEGIHVFDLGQNFSGVARLRVRGPAGTSVRLRFGEMLHADGRLMTENLRRARATDTYTLRGDPAGESWTPRFTYHGFRYVEVTGYPGTPGADAITGVVIHSDTPLTSRFRCSDPMVNRLFENIVWTQRSNFLEVPTDCPQRDERLGWTGDAQVYIRAATCNADVAAFFTKWLDDLEESQRSSGAYPAYAPFPMQHGIAKKSHGSAWMDAGIICPWTIWQVYGDTRVIERHYESMKRFMDFRRRTSPGGHGMEIGNPWGDWLAMGTKTPIELIDAVYYGYTARLMAEMAAAIGRDGDAALYRRLFEKVREAFREDWLREDGSLAVESQTAHALGLFASLLPEERRAAAAARLAKMIVDNDVRMATGFLGTRPLLPVLSATGHHDLAVRLIQSRRFPSWGYEVENGATTIWERWNSYTREGGFGNARMNSFSHYAFGAVGEWMFRDLAGIDTDGPGFRRIIIRPRPPTPGSNPEHRPIDRVEAEYRSIRGPIAVSWRRQPRRFFLEVSIPAGTTATVFLPAGETGAITEGDRSLEQSDGVRFLRRDGDRAVLEIGSGQYRFTSDLDGR